MSLTEMGVKIAPGREGSFVFCSTCFDLIQEGIRVIRYDPEMRMFDEVGVYHEACLKNPLQLLSRSEYHVIPAIFLRSAI